MTDLLHFCYRFPDSRINLAGAIIQHLNFGCQSTTNIQDSKDIFIGDAVTPGPTDKVHQMILRFP